MGALKTEDRRLSTVADGQEALALIRSSACDLLVAGQGRNGVDGLKLLRRARAIRPELKVIVTGEPDPQRVLGAIRNRAYSYFHNPLTPVPLAEMVQHALDADAWKDDIRVLSARPEW